MSDSIDSSDSIVMPPFNVMPPFKPLDFSDLNVNTKGLENLRDLQNLDFSDLNTSLKGFEKLKLEQFDTFSHNTTPFNWLVSLELSINLSYIPKLDHLVNLLKSPVQALPQKISSVFTNIYKYLDEFTYTNILNNMFRNRYK
jgi:hypothetical protein